MELCRTIVNVDTVIQLGIRQTIQVLHNDLLPTKLHCVIEEGIRGPRESGVQLHHLVVTRQRYEKDAGLYLCVLKTLRDYTAVKLKFTH